jgi:hypothetical protein
VPDRAPSSPSAQWTIPPNTAACPRNVIVSLGIGKVMSVTCTYDHRIIQGAESGMFLGKLQALLDGEDNFYDEIFEALQVPYAPSNGPATRFRLPRQPSHPPTSSRKPRSSS